MVPLEDVGAPPRATVTNRGWVAVQVRALQRIAVEADEACAAALKHPSDLALRQALSDALAALIEPAFLEAADGGPAHLRGCCRQACMLADSVRERIDASRRQGVADGSASMGIATLAKDLRRVLADITGWQEPARSA